MKSYLKFLSDSDPVGICDLKHNDVFPPLAVAILLIDDENRAVFMYNICQDCADSLQGDEWGLLVCLKCSATCWQLKEKARHKFGDVGAFLKGCPNCEIS